MMIVATLGTTIPLYLFFWQASQNVREMPLLGVVTKVETDFSPKQNVRCVRVDTIAGMTFSNSIAFFVMLMGGVVLRPVGVFDVKTSAQVARVLRRRADGFTPTAFVLGLVATGRRRRYWRPNRCSQLPRRSVGKTLSGSVVAR